MTASSIALAAITEDNPYDLSDFDKEIQLTNGSIYPNYTEASQFGENGACEFVQDNWGWSDSNCEAVDKILYNTAPNVGLVVIEIPQKVGYVEFDDWYKDNKNDDIDEIVKEIKKVYLEQSKVLGYELKWLEWIVYPTLVEDKNYMYYAYLASQDGVKNPVIEAMIYDRNGYVKFLIMPMNLTVSSSEAEYRKTVESALDLYTPNMGQTYADFRTGDNIYKFGVMGSLAALAGVSWKGKGKAAAAGIFGLILVFAKKLWWLIFLPFILLFKKIFRKKD